MVGSIGSVNIFLSGVTRWACVSTIQQLGTWLDLMGLGMHIACVNHACAANNEML
jgi:hypothetical protein